jgi:hypothetical protein
VNRDDCLTERQSAIIRGDLAVNMDIEIFKS